MVTSSSQYSRQDALIFSAGKSAAELRQIQRRVAGGELHKVHSGIFSSLPPEHWPELINSRRNEVLGTLFPNSVVAFRSAFDGALSRACIYLSGSYTRSVQLPGLTVEVVKGPGPVAGDQPLGGTRLYFPGHARILIDAIAPAPRSDRGDDGVVDYPRSVSEVELEERLLSIYSARGRQWFTALRGEIETVANAMGRPGSASRLDRKIGALLGTQPQYKLATAAGIGMAGGYDGTRLELFRSLAAALNATPLPLIGDVASVNPATRHFAFIESYFSNFIEGTEFEIGEARDIALHNKISVLRPQDSRDIRGVFDQANLPQWRALSFDGKAGHFEELIRERHRDMMAAREEVDPGNFKSQVNRVGASVFVEPLMVRGTLREAAAVIAGVEPGLPRALMMMFVVTEIHPFNDGNGRIARLMMNSELSALGLCRIIVPTLNREPYLDALRKLTQGKDPQLLIRELTKSQDWTGRFEYNDLDALIDQLRDCNAFERSLVRFKLLMPTQRPSERSWSLDEDAGSADGESSPVG